ncbi:ArsR/SmtB family transcription factor [Demequina rhizosphaerae]|uniref:ArsR/SmtB family transcription factor n=1 Tax=Demequina rhizosphaerae TaxID=1638985 RepID=UPI00078431A6|nr:metalloregulator ArsR/SmtB family transcription factor [Demequina rhizosphaerae]
MTESSADLRTLFDDSRELFVAFGDRHRQDIVVALTEDPNLTVREVAEQIGLSRPATSHHLRILREAGLLGERREGRKTFYYPTLRTSFEQLRALLAQVERQGRPLG